MEALSYAQDMVALLLNGAMTGVLLFALLRKWKPELAQTRLLPFRTPALQLMSLLGILCFVLWVASEMAIIRSENSSEASEYYFYSRRKFCTQLLLFRGTGPTLLLLVSQLFWWKRFRNKAWPFVLFVLFTPFAVHSDWLVLVITSLHRDFLVSSGSMYGIPEGLLFGPLKGLVAFSTLVWIYHKFIETRRIA